MIDRSNKRFTLLFVYEETHPQAKPAGIIIHDSCVNEKITRNEAFTKMEQTLTLNGNVSPNSSNRGFCSW